MWVLSRRFNDSFKKQSWKHKLPCRFSKAIIESGVFITTVSMTVLITIVEAILENLFPFHIFGIPSMTVFEKRSHNPYSVVVNITVPPPLYKHH